jgi:hypothetical protein
MTTYPRDHLTAAQVDALHAQFLACGGLCDAWVDTTTQAIYVSGVHAHTLAFVARHIVAIETGTLRLIQW